MSHINGNNISRFANIDATAFQAATDGLAAMTQDGALDQSLKLFGGFDHSTFDRVAAQATQAQPAIQNAGDYPKPAQMLKDFAANSSKDYMVPFSDVVKHLADPRFNASDSLASFSKNRMPDVLNAAAQKGIIIIGGKPDGTGAMQQKVHVGTDAEEKGIIIINSKPSDLLGGEKGIIIVNGRPEDLNNGQNSAETQAAFAQDSLLKLQKMQETTVQQLKLYQNLNYSRISW
jgi:hypothetical protein